MGGLHRSCRKVRVTWYTRAVSLAYCFCHRQRVEIHRWGVHPPKRLCVCMVCRLTGCVLIVCPHIRLCVNTMTRRAHLHTLRCQYIRGAAASVLDCVVRGGFHLHSGPVKNTPLIGYPSAVESVRKLFAIRILLGKVA